MFGDASGSGAADARRAGRALCAISWTSTVRCAPRATSSTQVVAVSSHIGFIGSAFGSTFSFGKGSVRVITSPPQRRRTQGSERCLENG